MIEGVQNLVQQVGIPLEEALRMASLYPARAMGRANDLGSIAEGKVANLVIFDDAFNVTATLVHGTYQEHR